MGSCAPIIHNHRLSRRLTCQLARLSATKRWAHNQCQLASNVPTAQDPTSTLDFVRYPHSVRCPLPLHSLRPETPPSPPARPWAFRSTHHEVGKVSTACDKNLAVHVVAGGRTCTIAMELMLTALTHPRRWRSCTSSTCRTMMWRGWCGICRHTSPGTSATW